VVIAGIEHRDRADWSWLSLTCVAEFGEAESIGARKGDIEIRLLKLVKVGHGGGELGDVNHDVTILTEFQREVVHAKAYKRHRELEQVNNCPSQPHEVLTREEGQGGIHNRSSGQETLLTDAARNRSALYGRLGFVGTESEPFMLCSKTNAQTKTRQ